MTDRITAKVHKSLKYDKFIAYKGNRGTNPAHVKRLMLSMEQHGWIDSLPMTVKPNGKADTLHVIDGHTRFTAARELKIPVKYVVVDGEINDADIYLINETQKGWTSTDYAKSWSHQGKEDYTRLLEFMDEYHVGLTTSVILLTQNSNRLTQVISSGQFKIRDMEWAISTLNYIIRMNSAIPFSAKKQRFVIAFLRARRIADFDPERFVHQVTKYSEQVKDYASAHDIAQNFEDVYNYNRLVKNQVPLAFAMEQMRKNA